MVPSNFIEWLGAAADTRFINGPFAERGGIMIIGPPGSFKNTMIEAALEDNPEALILSNLNGKQWNKIRPAFVNRRLTTLAIPELEVIYARNASTAMMCEKIIQRLICDGDRGVSEDPRMLRSIAHGLVIGGITDDCYERRFDGWERSGFARRWLWMMIRIDDPRKVLVAIRQWKKLDFGAVMMKPANREIPMDLTEQESKQIEFTIMRQPGYNGTGYVLAKKIMAVLKWKFKKQPDRPWEILKDIAPAFSKSGAELVL